MSEFAPLTVAVAWMLDPLELSMGYDAGIQDEAEPVASVYSLSYQHGWACGQVAAGHREPSPVLVAVAYGFHLAKSCTDACNPSSGPCLPLQ